MSVCLVAEAVSKRYGSVTALDKASLVLREGEILALLGPNGAGKTTLIKILTTLLQMDGGKVTIFGHDLVREAEQIRHLIGYVGQDSERSAYARLTVWENLRFFGRLRGLTPLEIDRQVCRLAEYFEFQAQLDRQFVTLSGGQKQTAVIMRGLLHDPPLIYLDEPTKGLDPLVARRIRRFLRRLAQEEGKTMLLTSHVLSEVEVLADRVALIHKGKIPIHGTPQTLKNGVGVNEFIEVARDALPHLTLAKIQALPQVSQLLERRPGWYSFGVTEPMAGAEAIIRVLRSEGIVADFRLHSVSLEDAFVHYIGELTEQFER